MNDEQYEEQRKCKCRLCDLVWTPRKKEPRACPRCHSYNWR